MSIEASIVPVASLEDWARAVLTLAQNLSTTRDEMKRAEDLAAGADFELRTLLAELRERADDGYRTARDLSIEMMAHGITGTEAASALAQPPLPTSEGRDDDGHDLNGRD